MEIHLYEFCDEGAIVPFKKDGVFQVCKIDEEDVDFFNSNLYMEDIYAAHNLFVASRYNGYPMIPGLPLVSATQVKLGEKQSSYGYCQRLHVQVAIRSGFDRKLLYSRMDNDAIDAYVVHHDNHNRLDARRENLFAVPRWLNLMMQKTSKSLCFPGVKKTATGNFSCSISVFGTSYSSTYPSFEEAARAFVQIKLDMLRGENGYSEFVRVYNCGSGEWEVVNAMEFAYVRDIRENKDVAATRLKIIRNSPEKERIAGLEYKGKKVIIHIGSIIRVIRGFKVIKIQL